jgi:hypothetical protein
MDYQQLKTAIQRKKKLIDQHQKDLAQLLEQCQHEETEPREHYYPGSYLDRAHTEYWTECMLCGARSATESENHSWYG